MFSDDDFMDLFVVKGGNALNIIYGLTDRSSVDIDISMESDFSMSVDIVREKLERSLQKVFEETGYVPFDVTLKQKPKKLDDKYKNFWGGYTLEFKIIDYNNYVALKDNLAKLRVNAVPIAGQNKKFKIDISKHEYCDGKVDFNIGNYTIQVYSLAMIVYEKLRAICQQNPKYKEIVVASQKDRFRDFFDIYNILESKGLREELLKAENLDVLKKIFAVKKVPLDFLKEIEKQKTLHQTGYLAVKASTSKDIKECDFYYDYVVSYAKDLLEHIDSNDC